MGASKIAGCICDPGFHGHDCSLRVCPGGHDPLDIQGEDKIDTNSATSTTNPSPFTKTNERQMLSMDSSHGAVSGTFNLEWWNLGFCCCRWRFSRSHCRYYPNYPR